MSWCACAFEDVSGGLFVAWPAFAIRHSCGDLNGAVFAPAWSETTGDGASESDYVRPMTFVGSDGGGVSGGGIP